MCTVVHYYTVQYSAYSQCTKKTPINQCYKFSVQNYEDADQCYEHNITKSNKKACNTLHINSYIRFLKNYISNFAFCAILNWQQLTVALHLKFRSSYYPTVSGCANLIDSHPSLQSSHGCKLNTV